MSRGGTRAAATERTSPAASAGLRSETRTCTHQRVGAAARLHQSEMRRAGSSTCMHQRVGAAARMHQSEMGGVECMHASAGWRGCMHQCMYAQTGFTPL
eukprot:134856-Chlamydomonas_euryale.AAC.5